MTIISVAVLNTDNCHFMIKIAVFIGWLTYYYIDVGASGLYVVMFQQHTAVRQIAVVSFTLQHAEQTQFAMRGHISSLFFLFLCLYESGSSKPVFASKLSSLSLALLYRHISLPPSTIRYTHTVLNSHSTDGCNSKSQLAIDRCSYVWCIRRERDKYKWTFNEYDDWKVSNENFC
jgi:hypothetical protein